MSEAQVRRTTFGYILSVVLCLQAGLWAVTSWAVMFSGAERELPYGTISMVLIALARILWHLEVLADKT